MSNDMINELCRRDGEAIDDYIERACKCRESCGLTWEELKEIINAQCGLSYGESHYRKNYVAKIRNDSVAEELKEVESKRFAEQDEKAKSLAELMQEIKRERVKLTDERVQTNAEVRRLSREETIKEIAHDFAREMNAKKLLDVPRGNIAVGGDRKAILELSDWHYGIVIDNHWNKYDPDIARERISYLLDETIRICKKEDVSEIHVVNLADLICGRIHLPLRLQSRFDVITQIMEVSEIMAEFLNTLSTVVKVHYYDCLDNHSRLEPNKSDSIDLESLARITPWYLKERLGNSISIHANEFGDDIITFEIFNHKILGVHGDKDSPRTAIDSLSMMTHQHYDLILTAHLHHFSADEKNETLIIANGSLMGTDNYAKNLRLSAKPSQNLIIVSPQNVLDCLYRIILD